MYKKAIVLAGTLPHIAVIENLKSRGYKVILIDFNPNCPARKYADKYINQSTLDKEAILKIAQDENVDLVISIVGDHINAVSCYVAEKMNLPHPYSYQTALNITRKSLMKPILKENGVPTSDYYILDKNSLNQQIQLDFPLVVKPSDGNSSKGVFCVTNGEELKSKIYNAFSLSSEGKVIVEQYVHGTEIQVDCMAIEGKAYLCMIKDMCSMPLDGKELQALGFIAPGVVCSNNVELIQETAQKIVDAFGLKNSVFFYQAKINDKGIFVMEAAARMAGGTPYDSVCLSSNIDYVDMSIRGFLGEPIKTIPKRNGKRFVGRFLTMKPGTFGSFEGADLLIDAGILVRAWCFVNSNTTITDSNISSNRVATIMAECDSYEEGERKIKEALNVIAIFDIHGNDLSGWR